MSWNIRTTLTQRFRKAMHLSAAEPQRRRSRGEALLLAVGSAGYVGYLPASGTLSVALVGVPGYLLLAQLPGWAYLVAVVAFGLGSVWLHGRGDAILGEKDSARLVLDELTGFWVAMAWVPALTWQMVVLGFVLERGLDILKPFPAGLLERRVPGGWGVVIDDVVAGLYARGALQVAWVLAPAWVGGAAL